MAKRKNYSPGLKAKGALEALREEMTLAELSKKYSVHRSDVFEGKMYLNGEGLSVKLAR